MGVTLQHWLKQSRFESVQQEALLNLMVAAHFVRKQVAVVCAEFELTAAQYNVLRILKGAHPHGYPRCEIISRMIEPAPDVTRLIDRLAKMGLVQRMPSPDDRRLSIAVITEKGSALLEKMRPRIRHIENTMLSSRLSEQQCQLLSDLCEQVYASQTD